MTIRSKLAWTFIILLVFGITAISSYSILFIRNYLLSEGKKEITQDTRWLAVSVENISSDEQFERHVREVARISGYQLALYDKDGKLLTVYPDTAEVSPFLESGKQVVLRARDGLPLVPDNTESEKIVSYSYLPQSSNEGRFIRLSQFKDRIYAPIKTIRWIIYYGMFISMGLIIVVSIWIARYLTKPIRQIRDAATEIAAGDVDRQIDLDRSDEFGTLAESLNRMASTLREDTERIKEFARKQRRLFADIAHEIRNPLHTISASLEMLEMDTLPQDKREKYHSNAKKQVERMSRLFKDLVALQRYDSDERFIEKEEFDLGRLAGHMVEWHGGEAENKDITFEADTHPCRVVGDPDKMEQVLDNLISNAVKYTNEGRISLCYTSRGDRVRVEVSDTGTGIAQEHLNRLFDRFYRTDKARSRDKGGTGLGLAVVKSILNAHETEIEVESELGKGTVFRFWLPAS